MSALSEILDRMQVEEYGTVPQKEVEQQIKSLFLELVGEDIPDSDVNPYRAKLREAINKI